MLARKDFDYLLVGGGLQNGLIALFLSHFRPQARVLLLERGAALGGNHLWCFHGSDIPKEQLEALSGVLGYQWERSAVLFGSSSRVIERPYFGMEGSHLHRALSERAAAGSELRIELHSPVRDVGAQSVTLDNGDEYQAAVVIDARGPEQHSPGKTGYQKFFGLDLELKASSPVPQRDTAVLMDADVDQRDGFRFFYVLPLSANTAESARDSGANQTPRVFIEETFFNGSPDLDLDASEQRILAYAKSRGFAVRSIRRRERGCLPMPYGATPQASQSLPLLGGYAGGWFHPGTGYSFPVAARLAAHVATTEPSELFGAEYQALVRSHAAQCRYAKWLNRLLFSGFAPEARRNVLERFYRLPEETIQRFYSMNLTSQDKARILCGRPPQGLSLGAAFKNRAGALA